MNQFLKRLFSSRRITDLEAVRNSKAFCIMPWVHLFVSQEGTVVPCCLTPWGKEQALGDVNRDKIEDIWNGKAMRAFRAKLLKDQKDKRCKNCYLAEEVGMKSSRKMNNYLFGHLFPWVESTQNNGYAPDSKPVYWDIRISNLCNFRCRICGHHSSSQWYEDAKAMGTLYHEVKLQRGLKDFDQLIGQLEGVIPQVEEIYFAGGEPLIMEEHYRLLEKLLKMGKTDLKLRYNTNFSLLKYKGREVFEYWKDFREVFVHASLDGTGERGELQRKGQDWEQVLENRKRMKEVCPHVDFMLTPTISIFNALHLPDFHRDWTEAGLIHVDEFMPHLLHNPPPYSIRVLPPEMKKEVREKVERHLDWIIRYAERNPPPAPSEEDQEKHKDIFAWIEVPSVTGHTKLDIVINEFRHSLEFMESGDDSHLLPEFRALCAQLDELRAENTAEVFPELAPLFS